MKITSLISLGLVVTLLANSETAPVVTKENVSTFYRQFQRLTKQPHYVAPLTATLCDSPDPKVIEREKRATGPHYQTHVHIYANAPADHSITRKLAAFPVGAVIVKEKVTHDGAVTGIGGMIKRPPGFDATNGDWEYFYSDKTSGFSTGRLQNCIACHADAKRTDYVFGAWKTPQTL